MTKTMYVEQINIYIWNEIVNILPYFFLNKSIIKNRKVNNLISLLIIYKNIINISRPKQIISP